MVLLQMGFTMPALSPKLRCALTTPFHPYQNGGIFSVALSLRSPSLDVIQHFDPEEPGLSSIKFMAVIQPSAILYYLFIYFICQILYYFFNFKSSSNIASSIHFSSSSLSSLLLLSNSKDKYLYFFKSDKVFLSNNCF